MVCRHATNQTCPDIAHLSATRSRSFRSSLKALSTRANSTMMDKHMFNIYRHGFQKLVGEKDKFDRERIESYADAIVRDLLDLN